MTRFESEIVGTTKSFKNEVRESSKSFMNEVRKLSESLNDIDRRKAEEMGMAIKVPLTKEDASKGFDTVIVLGLNANTFSQLQQIPSDPVIGVILRQDYQRKDIGTYWVWFKKSR